MKEISLTNGYIAQIDDSDYEAVIAAGPWFAELVRKGEIVYASRNYKVASGKRGLIRMHRFLTNASPNDLVDHRDGNGLNNQRFNLRLCNKTQNQGNRRKTYVKNCSSKFKGVFWDKSRNKWLAIIGIGGKQKNLGRYFCEEDAARAYDSAAKDYFKEFALLNFS